MAINYEVRFSNHPEDAKHYDTQKLRKEFLVETLMVPGEINLVYSMNDRYIVGGAVPTDRLELTSIDPLKSDHFCDRRELGFINVGGPGLVLVDGTEYPLEYKEALYVGAGSKKIEMISTVPDRPAHLYFNSAPAHHPYPCRRVTLNDAEVMELGSLEQSNARRINKLLVNSVVETNQLQMGMTELQPGSVWNTMPPHLLVDPLRSRDQQLYFYLGDGRREPGLRRHGHHPAG